MGWQRLMIAPSQRQGEQIRLTAAQRHYLQRVLRLGAGEKFVAVDGCGGQWLAALTAEGATVLEARAVALPSTPVITLAAALPKGSGFDAVVRQATELGVSCIQPILSERTLLRPSSNRLERWRRIAAEATEQCERATAPNIQAPLAWGEFLEASSGIRLLCVARGAVPPLLACVETTPLTVATGPEGGWSGGEVEGAIATGFQPVTLGPQVLRAVTAPLAALAQIQGYWGLGQAADHPPQQPGNGD